MRRAAPASMIGISTAEDALIATAATSAMPAPTSIHGAGSPSTSGRGMPSSQAQARAQAREHARSSRCGAGRARLPTRIALARNSSQNAEHEEEQHQEVVVVAAEPPDEHDRVDADDHGRGDRVAPEQPRAAVDQEHDAEAREHQRDLHHPERARDAERHERRS